MGKISSTVWDPDPHTFAKHEILKTYLSAWAIILSRQLNDPTRRLLFIDGFAGPGKYSGGQEGSPIIALKTIAKHTQVFPTPVDFLFIERDTDRLDSLKAEIEKHKPLVEECPNIGKICCKQGDCEILLDQYLNGFEKLGRKLGPILAFLDQFGFSDISMDLIKRIMAQPKCEVFSYLHCEGLKRFCSHDPIHSSISKAFGNEDWKKAFELQGPERIAFLRSTYEKNLHSLACAKYVWHFTMCNQDNQPIYWLFFCTQHLKGLEKMKEAMWKADPTGGFRFSDKNNPNQYSILISYTVKKLAEDIYNKFAGQSPSVSQVKEFVLTETPEYRHKSALRLLEDEQKLKPIDPYSNRKFGTFPDKYENMLLEFIPKSWISLNKSPYLMSSRAHRDLRRHLPKMRRVSFKFIRPWLELRNGLTYDPWKAYLQF